nr:hypothetical protein CFP56_05411 [Quercus suber]
MRKDSELPKKSLTRLIKLVPQPVFEVLSMENDVVCSEAQLPIVEFMHGLPLINSGCRYCIDYLVQCKTIGEAHLIGVKFVD